MTTLHLGVADIPYANPPRAKGSKASSGTQTTGDVAEWLEAKYHVMEVFFALHADEIAKALESSVAGSLENLLLGGPAQMPTDEAMSAIEERFRKFLSEKEMEGLGIPGVPTRAAQLGKSKRFKNGYGPANRPSFIDTGAYEAAFKAWITENFNG